MLKKILFSIVTLFTFSVYSQCIPNTDFTGLMGLSDDAYELTDSTTALPHATVGFSYETFFDLRIPLDTAITYDLGNGPQDFDPVFITTIAVNEVQGLPMGFDYQCSAQSALGTITDNVCVFEGGGYGCLRLYSDEVPAVVGTYPLNVVLDIAASYEILGISVPVEVTDDTMLNYLVLIVEEGNNSSHNEILDARKFGVFSSFPNPASENCLIQYGNNIASEIDFRVYDMLGNLVFSKYYHSTVGYNEILFDSSKLLSGIYTFTLSNNTELITERIIVK
jgi:hypothetical protein